MNRILVADDNTRTVFDILKKDIKIKDNQWTGIPHYTISDKPEGKRGVYFNFRNDEKNKRGPGTTYFHECGHHVDHLIMNYKGFASDSTEFIEALKKDERYVHGLYDRMNQAQRDYLKKLLYTDTLHSVEDILNGVTFGGIKTKYCHGLEYWQEHPEMIQREAFAHFFEARMGGGRKLKYLYHFFPNASAVFDEIMENFGKEEYHNV